jgi:hypothetical protein
MERKAMLRIARTGLMSICLLTALSPVALTARSPGVIYTCQFRIAGTIVINTREPGATISVNGKRHAATSGSYFYQTTDGSEIVMMFGPGASMTKWTYQKKNGPAENAKYCKRKTN